MYALASVVVASITVAAGLLVWCQRASSLAYLSKHFYIEVTDPHGQEATLRKESEVLVKADNVTTLMDRNLAATGRLEFDKVNAGKLMGAFQEGALVAIMTTFDCPLRRGEMFKHILYMKAWDTYVLERESHSVVCDEKYGELGVHVTFPAERPCKEASAYGVRGHRISGTEPPSVSQDGVQVDWILRRPSHRGKYVLEWRW